MEARLDGRLPLIIVAGFLGAGKSTWLRHHLFEKKYGRVHVLVNEAAEVAVDDLLLQHADQLSILAGGCACCSGREDLLRLLRVICNENVGTAHIPVDTILLETSGIADPARIAEAIRNDPVLVRRIVISETIVLVDGKGLENQLCEEPLARRQIEAADQIIITKTDDSPNSYLSQLIATLEILAPDRDIKFSEFGVEKNIAYDQEASPIDLPMVQESEIAIDVYRLDLNSDCGWSELATWLSALLFVHGDHIIRVKGSVLTPAGRLLLQSVRKHVQAPEILPEPMGFTADTGENFIVLIGRGIVPELLHQSWQQFVCEVHL